MGETECFWQLAYLSKSAEIFIQTADGFMDVFFVSGLIRTCDDKMTLSQ